MRQIDCGRLRRNIDKLLAAEPADFDREELRSHLESCPSCRAELAAYFPLERWLEEPDSIQAPAGFTGRVMQRIEAITPVTAVDKRTEARGRVSLRRRTMFDYLATAAATIILMFTGFFSLFEGADAGAAAVNQNLEAFCSRTRQLLETGMDWQAVLDKPNAPDKTAPTVQNKEEEK